MADESTEELRLALVMNGGVSLAVWMGGVTNEIFRLVRERHPVYRDLLRLTRSTARVDVISGTSAGGINGAALALALLYNGDFAQLREVWLNTGSLDDLLRDPFVKNPGSLLKGEDYFLPEITQAFERLTDKASKALSPAQAPIDLRLTTTLLAGRVGNTPDDLGKPVRDVDHRAVFRFTHLDGHPSKLDDREAAIPALARAARSTASFPFAFEPSQVHVTKEGPNPICLEDVQGKALPSNFYDLLDGGILDNKPFHGALKSIFNMKATGSVRRVLAYVNPDAGAASRLTASTPLLTQPPLPALGNVIAASVVGIPQAQSISDQLEALREHNETVRKRRQGLSSVVGGFGPVATANLATTLFPVYRRRRIADSFDSIFDDIQEAAERASAQGTTIAQAVWPVPDTGAPSPVAPVNPQPLIPIPPLGKQQREWLRGAFQSALESGPSAPGTDPEYRLWWIPAQWSPGCDAAAMSIQDWEWGLFPVEFAARLTLDLLRRTQRLVDVLPARPAASVSTPAAEGSTGAQDRKQPGKPALSAFERVVRRLSDAGKALQGDAVAPEDWADPDEPGKSAQQTGAVDSASSLAGCWKTAYELVGKLEKQREDESQYWNRGADKVLAAIQIPDPDATRHYIREMFEYFRTDGRRRICGTQAHEFARLIAAILPTARQIANNATESPRSQRKALARELTDLCDFLESPSTASGLAPCTPEQSILHHILQLEVIEYAFSDHQSLSDDGIIELVQISADSKSPLGGKSLANQKLCGLQLAHFAAFYKRSWRANDWAFGRLDGAARLVKILLNPERLFVLYGGQKDAFLAALRGIAVDTVKSAALKAILQSRWDEELAGITEEVEFLDQVDPKLPEVLRACADAITTRLHYGILREELEQIKAAVIVDQSSGAEHTGAGQSLLRNLQPLAGAPFTPHAAVEQLGNGLLGKEKILAEAGSDLFTSTVIHALATLQGALSGKDAHLGFLTPVFAALRLPVLGLYILSGVIVRSSRTGAAVLGGILAVGVVLVALQFSVSSDELADVTKSFPGSMISFGWMVLALGMVFPLAKTPLTAFVSALLILLVAILAGHWWTAAPVIGVFTISMLLLWSVGRSWLQTVIGFLVLAFAALWGSANLHPIFRLLKDLRGEPPAPCTGHWWCQIDFQHPVVLSAALMALVLALGLWQMSSWSHTLERWLRKLVPRKSQDQQADIQGLPLNPQ